MSIDFVDFEGFGRLAGGLAVWQDVWLAGLPGPAGLASWLSGCLAGWLAAWLAG